MMQKYIHTFNKMLNVYWIHLAKLGVLNGEDSYLNHAALKRSQEEWLKLIWKTVIGLLEF